LIPCPSSMEAAMAEQSLPFGRDMVTALFVEGESAERAYRAALDMGYKDSEVNLIMSEDTRRRFFTGGQTDPKLREKAKETVEEGPSKPAHELGGPVGGTMGTMAPVLAAVGTLLLVPGIVIAGPVAVALTAAGAVGITGGVIGALTNWGIPKDRVERYEADIRAGGVLMGVKPRDDADARALKASWRASSAQLIDS
jgi:hypothetical protein